MLPKVDSSVKQELCHISQEGAFRRQIDGSSGCYPGQCVLPSLILLCSTNVSTVCLASWWFHLCTLPASFIWSCYKILSWRMPSMNENSVSCRYLEGGSGGNKIQTGISQQLPGEATEVTQGSLSEPPEWMTRGTTGWKETKALSWKLCVDTKGIYFNILSVKIYSKTSSILGFLFKTPCGFDEFTNGILFQVGKTTLQKKMTMMDIFFSPLINLVLIHK